jgi:hypothetical protein
MGEKMEKAGKWRQEGEVPSMCTWLSGQAEGPSHHEEYHGNKAQSEDASECRGSFRLAG